MEGELRQRKGKQEAAGDRGQEKEARGRGERVDRSFTLGLLLLVSLAGVAGGLLLLAPSSPPSILLSSCLDLLLSSLLLLPRQHAVVLDAGSTGSRVLAFTFHSHPVTGQLVLEDELWHEVKPGLSSYAEEPARGAESIASLLALAKARIPPAAWPGTPATLMATAGLRLLPHLQSEALLEAVRATMAGSGFEDRGTGIMGELEEGVYGWLTVNYLLGELERPEKSYVALDLGGGSTQITFAPREGETLASSPANFLHQKTVSSKPVTLYSHSYLGLGLMAAREAVLRTTSPTSPCVRQEVEFRGLTVVPSPVAGYEVCMVLVQEFLDTQHIHQPKELPERKIAAFSYFHDRAVDAGLLGEGESGVVRVEQYLEAADKACSGGGGAGASPFLCLDLTFIAGLLHHGYRLEAAAKLGLYKQIDGHQTSWALGAAFHLLQ